MDNDLHSAPAPHEAEGIEGTLPARMTKRCLSYDMLGEEREPSPGIAQTALASTSRWLPILSHIVANDDIVRGFPTHDDGTDDLIGDLGGIFEQGPKLVPAMGRFMVFKSLLGHELPFLGATLRDLLA